MILERWGISVLAIPYQHCKCLDFNFPLSWSIFSESVCRRSEGILSGRQEVLLPSVSSCTRNVDASIGVKGSRSQKGRWKNPWHDPKRRVLLWPTQGCFFWARVRLKSKLSSSYLSSCPSLCPWWVWNSRDCGDGGERGRTRTREVNNRVVFLLCHEACCSTY